MAPNNTQKNLCDTNMVADHKIHQLTSLQHGSAPRPTRSATAHPVHDFLCLVTPQRHLILTQLHTHQESDLHEVQS